MLRAKKFGRDSAMTRDQESPYATLMLRAWKRSRGSRLLVYAMTVTGVIDAVLTWISIENFGAVGELNPAILQFHRMGLLPVWAFITIVSSLLGGSILVSVCLMFKGGTRSIAAVAFGLLLGIRVTAITVSIGNCCKIPYLTSAGMLMGIGAFLFAGASLLNEATAGARVLVTVTARAILWSIKDFGFTLVDMSTELLQALLPTSQVKMKSSSDLAANVVEKRSKRSTLRKILVPIFLITVTLVALVGVLEYLRGTIFQSVPWWLRELGIVQQAQGQAFLVVFIGILLTLAVLTYCILSIVEGLSGPQD
jgi:hypothetical protein